MLKDDQAAELLHRCEALIGRKLAGVRGQLLNPEARASAVWELLCIDSMSQIGTVVYEPAHQGSSPDLILSGVGTRDICVEAGYLYPRHWKNDKRARELTARLYGVAASYNIAASRVSIHFFGQPAPAGQIRNLPAQQDLAKLLRSPTLLSFFADARDHPTLARETTFPPYTFRLKYDPSENGPFIHGSGVLEEAPTTVEEHALFRALRHKRMQHRPSLPYVVCIGSDQSFAVGQHYSPIGINENAAVREALRNSSRISAVIAIAIETPIALDHGYRKKATGRIYINDAAARPLEQVQVDALKQLDFNRWAYHFPLEQWESDDMRDFKRLGGPMTMSHFKETVSLTVPSTVLVDCLAGKTALKEHYPDSPDAKLLTCIENGWQVVGCSFEPGVIEQGLASRVKLVMARPPKSVYFKPAPMRR